MKINIAQTANISPNKKWDYCATLEGYEEGEPIGYGATHEEAKQDLINAIEE